MNTPQLIVVFLFCGVLLAGPLLYPDGQFLVVAALSTLMLYEGVRARVVYGSVGVLFLMEVLYGGDVGVSVVSYCLTVLLVMTLRRFVALPVWAARDGWRITDGVRTVGIAWAVSMGSLVLAVMVGDVFYGYGYVADRVMILAAPLRMAQIFLMCAVTCGVWRRISVPFRQEIRFGS